MTGPFASQWPPWIFINATDTSGPMKQVADALANSLNFTYEIEAPPDGAWGQQRPDGSWTSMVGMVCDNVSAGRTRLERAIAVARKDACCLSM